MQPILAVTMGSLPGDEKRPQRATLNAAYLQAVQAAGAVPVLLAPEMGEATIEALMAQVSGLVLTGGGDIDPARYGQPAHPLTAGVSTARDNMEDSALLIALERGLPVLAICRGMQLLNVSLGGSLHQHVPDVFGDELKHAQTDHGFARHEATHSIRVDPTSCLAGLLRTNATAVNSMHHQAIDRLGDGLVATAWASDGCIEGAEMRGGRFVVGVQWHPEEMASTSAEARSLFAGFVEAARTGVHAGA